MIFSYFYIFSISPLQHTSPACAFRVIYAVYYADFIRLIFSTPQSADRDYWLALLIFIAFSLPLKARLCLYFSFNEARRRIVFAGAWCLRCVGGASARALFSALALGHWCHARYFRKFMRQWIYLLHAIKQILLMSYIRYIRVMEEAGRYFLMRLHLYYFREQLKSFHTFRGFDARLLKIVLYLEWYAFRRRAYRRTRYRCWVIPQPPHRRPRPGTLPLKAAASIVSHDSQYALDKDIAIGRIIISTKSRVMLYISRRCAVYYDDIDECYAIFRQFFELIIIFIRFSPGIFDAYRRH